MRRIAFFINLLVLACAFFATRVLAAGTSIEGYVKDAKTGEPLFGANVMLIGTSMGATTDAGGKYVIQSVPPGTYTIRASYIGYKEQKRKISVEKGTSIKQNFQLDPVGIESETVVVTAQASGQAQAINQQLSSDKIVNVVSAAKIQELPDANAAESVGRLPGISIIREGGEGSEVVIRGLAPKYNLITIQGVQMPSLNPYDRSVDLSMISSNMLQGIQVSKNVTPDMEANTIGGTVNFELKEARVKEPGVPEFSLIVQGGYKNLADAYNKYNNYKYVGSFEDRLLNDKFGIFAQIDVERKNLSSNELGASYSNLGNSITQYIINSLSLSDIFRDRQRYNGAVVLDYKLRKGKIKFTNFISSGSTNIQNRNESFDVLANVRYYTLGSPSSKLSVITNTLDFQQELPIFQMDAKLSHSYSETKNPNNWSINFLQTGVGINQFTNLANVDPQEIPKAANNDFSKASLNNIQVSDSFSKQDALNASLDLKTNINLSDVISAEIKFGGEYRYQRRSYVYSQNNGALIGHDLLNTLIFPYFSLPSNASSMAYWIDSTFSYGKFLGGDYTMVGPLNFGMLSQLVNLLNKNVQYITNNFGGQYYGQNNFASTTNNYSGSENQTAFYVMSIINIGPQITFIPGVRYQSLRTTYTGVRGMENSQSYYEYLHYDTTVTQNHGYWLPDVSLRYKPLSWFDVRLSYTNTLAYPDFYAIVPRIDLGIGANISWNNYKLVPSRSTNYDVALSFYDNILGLFTADGFLKQIRDLIYPWSFYVTGAKAAPYMPWGLSGVPFHVTDTYQISTTVNDSYLINDYGIELDWQTHFWYLPKPLSSLVLGINYTHIFSKAQYPFTLTLVTRRSITYIDTSFTDRLLYQPDNILNLSLGFDYQDFSIRVAMIYQSDIFTGPNFWPQLRAHTSTYRRWDLAVNQKLPWFGLQIYGDINNINGADDVSVIEGGGVPLSRQHYDMTADLGLRWNF
jgi:TonB-dependent receptor